MLNHISPPKSYFALAALLSLLFAGCVDLGIINLGLPIISKELGLRIHNAQWIITIYFIASSAVMMASGSLGDNIGHRSVFLIGTIVLFCSSLLIGFSHNPNQIILGRFFQGLAFGICLPTLLSIASQLFPDQHRGLVVGLLSTITGLGLATGPIIGGFILEYLHWKWLFWFNLPFCVLAFILGTCFLPKAKELLQKRIDWLGMIWLIFASLSLVGVVSNYQNLLLRPKYLLVLSFASVVFIWGFFVYQIKKRNPFIKINMFENHAFSAICFIRFVSQSIIYIMLFVFGLYLINIAGFSPVLAGKYLLIVTGIYGVGSIVAGKLSDIYGYERLITLGLIPLIISCFALGLISLEKNNLLLVIVMVLVGLHMATTPNLTALVTKNVNSEDVGSGTGMFYTIGFFGSALGVALAGLCIAFTSFDYIQPLISQLPSNKKMILNLYQAAQGAMPLSELPNNTAAIAENAFTDSIQRIALCAGSLSLLCMIIMKRYLWPKR